MRWRASCIALHRDLGFFFAGVTLVYACSGVAVNHLDDWNPNYVIRRQDVALQLPTDPKLITAEDVIASLAPIGEHENFRSFDFPSARRIKIYLREGSIVARLQDGQGVLETVRRRPFLYRANLLHVNPQQWWKAFSDVFALSLIVITLTGLTIARGHRGLGGRGKWLVGAGLLVPLAAATVAQF